MSEPVPAEGLPVSGAQTLLRLGSTAIAAVLLALWGVWWVASVRAHHLVLGEYTWTFANKTLADDFYFHIDHTARVLASGRSIASETDIFCRTFPYPMMIPRLFHWVSWMGPKRAIAVWIGVLSAIFVASAGAVFRSRKRLNLPAIPLPWVMVMVLYATPVISAMERGQCDSLTIVFLMAGSAGLRAKSREKLAETAAGGLLGLAAWIKFYPGLVIVGLLSLRRWRAAVAFVAVAGAIGVMDFHSTLRAISNGQTIAARGAEVENWVHPLQHSLRVYWPAFWGTTPLKALASLPGPAVSVLMLGPVLGLVSWRMWRLGRDLGGRIAFPLFLWIIAAGTFALPYSNDYNLVFLPLAVLAVFDRKDPLWIAMALGVFAIYWQPSAWYVEPKILFLGKLLMLYGSGWCLCRRAVELGRETEEAGVSGQASAVPPPHIAVPGFRANEVGRVYSSPMDRGE